MIRVTVPAGEGKFTDFEHSNVDKYILDANGALHLFTGEYGSADWLVTYNTNCWLKVEIEKNEDKDIAGRHASTD